jgi:hypothetical protein
MTVVCENRLEKGKNQEHTVEGYYGYWKKMKVISTLQKFAHLFFCNNFLLERTNRGVTSGFQSYNTREAKQ